VSIYMWEKINIIFIINIFENAYDIQHMGDYIDYYNIFYQLIQIVGSGAV